jgi:hypothetical protein
MLEMGGNVDNVIEATDQPTTSGAGEVQLSVQAAEDMTAPMISALAMSGAILA